MTPNYVLRGFPRKVRLRISRSDEWCVWRCGCDGTLRDTLFSAIQDGAENGNEELPTLPSKGITKRAVCNAGWDGLQGRV